MITYFKYTSGESFTLNGSDYSGYFNILDGIVYTGREYTDESEVLTPKDTFTADVYTSEQEFNTTYKDIPDLDIQYSNTFELFNNQQIQATLSTINDNNLACFRSLVLANPIVFNYDQSGNHFYGIEPSDVNSIDLPAKSGYMHIDPIENSSNWGFMNDVATGGFVVDSYENFKYLCADDTDTYILEGSFIDDTPLTKTSVIPNTPYYDVTHQIYHDYLNSKIFFIKNDEINVYDSSNYDTCDNLILVDKIGLIPTTTTEYIWGETEKRFEEPTYDEVYPLWENKYVTDNDNNPEFIRFGKNLRTSWNGATLSLINKYSSDVFQNINLSIYNITNLIDLDIRDEDDHIIILHSIEGDLYVCSFDPTDVSSTIINTELLSIESGKTHRIKFSDIDSNTFYTHNEVEYQTRFLTNPTYPAGRLEMGDLKYLRDYIWDTTTEFPNYIPIQWNSGSIKSNYYSNIINSRNDKYGKMYMLLHNNSRLYALRQPMSDRYFTAIAMDLEKYFGEAECSESSLGIYFNTLISNLLKDTLNIFNKAKFSFDIHEREVLQQELDDFSFVTENFFINGNETINAITLQRIILLITNIQKKILSSTN